MSSSNKKKIVVGTDCSGIDAPIWALKKLHVPFVYAFSSDIDKNSHDVIGQQSAKMRPQQQFWDVTERDHRLLPHLDIYVAGFPCQPFSTLGKRDGHDDIRAKVFHHILKTIDATQPSIFVLENVSNLAVSEAMYEPVRKCLCRYETDYEIHLGILNSADYGVPQRRNRLFIVGIRRSRKVKCHIMRWPPMRKRPRTIDSILDPGPNIPEKYRGMKETKKRVLASIRKSGGDSTTEPWIYSTGVSPKFANATFNIAPTLTKSHTHDLWITNLERFLSVREIMALQGFPRSFKPHKSRTVACEQAGNSMTVDVVAVILDEALKAIGFY